MIDPARAMDWTTVGVPGGVPSDSWTQSGATISAYGTSGTPGSPTTIQTALDSCGTNQYVQLGAGTFHLSGGLTVSTHNNCEIRGGGANTTFLVFHGNAFCNGYTAYICAVGANSGPNGENNVCSWSSGYSQGGSTINVTSCGSVAPNVGSLSNLKVGNTIILDQVNETFDTGGFWNCVRGANDGTPYNENCAQETTGGFARNNGPSVNGTAFRSQQQVVRVTGCDSVTTDGHVCSSGVGVTISPSIYLANWTSAQSPQVWYGNSVAKFNGIRDLSIDSSDHVTAIALYNITLMNCYGCWVQGVRSLYGSRGHIMVNQVLGVSILDNYFHEAISHNTQSYTVEIDDAASVLVQNNIGHRITDSLPTCNGGCQNVVVGHNFCINTQYAAANWFQGCFYLHAGGGAQILFEGNQGPGMTADNIHGTNHFITLFRNFLPGWQLKCNLGASTCSAQTNAINLYAGTRFVNLIGNVLGTPGYHTNYDCAALSTANCGVNAPVSVYSIGYTWNGSTSDSLSRLAGFCTDPTCAARDNYDGISTNSLMRWGNYEPVNGVRWNSGEVPSGYAVFPNAVPSSHTLPASFYLSAKPNWWPNTLAWPAVGPDVTSGTIQQCSGGTYDKMPVVPGKTCTGGSAVTAWSNLANPNPAANCFFTTMGGSIDGSDSALNFDRATCYPTSDSNPPTRSAGAPSGTIAYTTSTTLSLTTDEAATCKYSTSAGVAYASMSNTFGTTGGTSQSTTVSGLSAGSFTYYVRCIDGSSNANTDDYTISFTVSAPAATRKTGVGVRGGGGRKI